MPNPFLVLEAINSVALSHDADCTCKTCRAAHGDSVAFAEIISELEQRVNEND